MTKLGLRGREILLRSDDIGIEAQFHRMRNGNGRGASAEGSEGTCLADDEVVAELLFGIRDDRLSGSDFMVFAEVGHKIVDWVGGDAVVIAEDTGGDVVASVGEQRLPSQGDGGGGRNEGSKSHPYN